MYEKLYIGMISNSHLAVHLVTLNDQKEQNYSILTWQIQNIYSPCMVLSLVMEGKSVRHIFVHKLLCNTSPQDPA